MTSQIESIISTKYTPLYENEKFERELSQWRLLINIGTIRGECKTKEVKYNPIWNNIHQSNMTFKFDKKAK